MTDGPGHGDLSVQTCTTDLTPKRARQDVPVCSGCSQTFLPTKKTRTTAEIRGEKQFGLRGHAVQYQDEYWQYSYCDNEFPHRYYLTASRWGTSLSSAPNYA